MPRSAPDRNGVSFWWVKTTPANHTIIDDPTLTGPTLEAMDPTPLRAPRLPKHVRCQLRYSPAPRSRLASYAYGRLKVPDASLATGEEGVPDYPAGACPNLRDAT